MNPNDQKSTVESQIHDDRWIPNLKLHRLSQLHSHRLLSILQVFAYKLFSCKVYVYRVYQYIIFELKRLPEYVSSCLVTFSDLTLAYCLYLTADSPSVCKSGQWCSLYRSVVCDLPREQQRKVYDNEPYYFLLLLLLQAL